MTSPYSSTPRFPRGPNPTPRSTQKGLRPPIHNPYDKFTQPEFDAWISDITGALKRALGQEDAPPPPARAPSHPAEDEGLEDSFAEVKARRLAKGKERAREEDIEAEPARVDDEEEDDDGWGQVDSGEDYSGQESGESEEEEAPRGARGTEAEVIDLLSDDDEDAQAQHDDNEAEEEEEEEDADAEAEEYDEEAEGSDVSSEDNDHGSRQSSPAAGPSHTAHSHAHEVTEILDSEEEADEQEEQDERDDRHAVPPRFQRKPALVASRPRGSDDEEQDAEFDEEQNGEEDSPFPPREDRKEPVDIDDPWRGPTMYAEDLYTGGDIPTSAVERGNPHTLSDEEDADDLAADEPAHTPDLPDPWEGPRQFAEDFYAGGDALPNSAEGVTPSHLTPKDEGRLFIPGISPAPAEEKTTEARATSPEVLDVDDLYGDVDDRAVDRTERSPQPEQEAQAVAAETVAEHASDAEESAEERSPSPPSATLRKHVDWNWPPAFPGRVATRPGHIESPDQEVFEVSDDEDQSPASPERQSEPQTNTVPAQTKTDEPANDDEEPMPVTVDDTSGLYNEFDDLYGMDPARASFDMQASFEPISPPGLDFGDLPGFSRAFSATEVDREITALDAQEAQPSLEAFISPDASSSPKAPEGDAETEMQTMLADADIPAVETIETRRFSVELEEVTDEDEPTQHRSAKSESLGVVVVEVDDDDDIRSTAPLGDDIDISSVRGDVEASAVEYVVEEAVTEGRRTEEPEAVAWEADETVEITLPDEPAEVPHASNEEVEDAAPAEATEAEAVDTASPAESPNLVYPSEDPAQTEAHTSPSPQPPVSETTQPRPPAPTVLERTLSGNPFPPPISANPNVPDPASLTHTPRSPSPASPTLPEAKAGSERERESTSPHDATALPTNAALHPLFRKLAAEDRTRSPSGLFTPLTEGPSVSVTPEGGESPEAQFGVEEGKDDVGADGEEVDELEDDVDEAEQVDELEASEQPAEPVEEVAEPAEESAPIVEDVRSVGEEVDTLAEEPVAVDQAVPDVKGKSPEPSPQEVAEDSGPLSTKDAPAAEARGTTPGTDVDADAEGEVDPEYASSAAHVPEEVPAETAAEASAPAPEEFATTNAHEAAVDDIHPVAEPAEVEEVSDEPDAPAPTEHAAPSPAELPEGEPTEAPAPVEPSKEPQAVPEAPVVEAAPSPILDESTPAEAQDEWAAVAEAQDEPVVAEAQDLAVTAEAGDDVAAEAKDELRPLKRKRGSAVPATRIPRLTRSKTSLSVQNAFKDHVEKTMAKAKAAKTKGKGKGKLKASAPAASDEDDNVSVAHSHASGSTSGSSAAAAQQMLVPDSRGTSRASSVVSNAPSAYSGLSQPSPTIDRILPTNGNLGPPPPFFHNHGILHHHHGRPVAPVVPVVQRRQPSEPPVSPTEVIRRASAEPGPSSQPLPSRPPPTQSMTSSPVTRSNCRFHTISIPKEEEENAPRVHFAVPGCSLGGNADLMKEEDIEDQGFVKSEDIPRLIRDVETLNLSPYLVGVLRQLVGVDLIREQEVFYLPRPDDGVVLPSKRKSHRAKLKQRESISARTLSNGGASRPRDASSMAPPSQASISTSGDSASTAGRLSQRGSATTAGSVSDSALSDMEEDEAPPTKRVKEDHAAAADHAQPAEQPPPEIVGPAQSETNPTAAASENGAGVASSSTASGIPRLRKLQPRRSRRLGTDAAAYKPDGGESDGSDDEGGLDEKKKRRKGGKRGLKRTRTEENGDGPPAGEGAEEKPKRRRVKTSSSTTNGHKPAADAEDTKPPAQA
ncbi:hypothetical protein C8Q77DRAFT_1144676 [Trametes polyzona]|nr:hypothetical protein C8Q77DRAFT_1144676 [Trametes polyzona]